MTYDNAIARIVSQMERPGTRDLWDTGTPVADEVQRLAEDLAVVVAELADLAEDLEAIDLMCLEVLTGDVPSFAAGKVRAVVDMLKAEMPAVPDVNELMVGWTSDLCSE